MKTIKHYFQRAAIASQHQNQSAALRNMPPLQPLPTAQRTRRPTTTPTSTATATRGSKFKFVDELDVWVDTTKFTNLMGKLKYEYDEDKFKRSFYRGEYAKIKSISFNICHLPHCMHCFTLIYIVNGS